MDRQQQFVLRTLEERDIRFVRLWFTDVLGYLKSVAVAPAELEGAFSEGIGFDGSAVEGYARVYESDMIAKPDPSTFQVLPWETDEGKVYSARMFCDITMPDGSPSWADPRHVLRRVMGEAASMGFTCYVHPEIEFFLMKELPSDGSAPEPADQGGFFDQASHDVAPHFRRRAIETLEAMGISVEFSHHEGAPGQQEIDLRYADALTMADNIMSFRYVVKEVAITQGVHASFMPKPFPEHPGSAMHTHFSLFEGETNAFYDADDEYQMSPTGKAFLAGVLKHAAEI
ncbi:MAG: glutamine synthetase family protein, partial [Actinomycetota bacterium]|nr:glutamine synthetase family protein [Actinomycetota bacterium]